MPVKRYKLFSGDGFTLLEVLVALVILGLAIAFLSSTISDSLGRADHIDTDDRASSLADAILAQVGHDLPLKNGVIRGHELNLDWRLTIFPEASPGGENISVDRVHLTIVTSADRTVGSWDTLRIAPSSFSPR